MKRFVSLIFCIFMFFCFFPSKVFASADNIYFPDKNLEYALMQNGVDQNGDGSITKSEIEAAKHLSISGYTDKNNKFVSYNISDLTGIEYAKNVTFLDISKNMICNIDTIKGLNKLTKLYLGQNPIEDFSVLSNLTSLQIFNAPYNDLSDVRILTNLTKLKELSIAFSSVSDISPLKSLKNLQYMSVYKSKVSEPDIESFVSEMTNLKEITLYPGMQADINDLITPKYLFSGTIHWTSEESTVASVSTGGIVTANKEGNTKIIGITDLGYKIFDFKVTVSNTYTSAGGKADSLPQIVEREADGLVLRYPLNGNTAGALYPDGSLWVWGDFYENTAPHKILTNVKQYFGKAISPPNYNDDQTYFYAITNDNSFWAWGDYNSFSSKTPVKLADELESVIKNFLILKDGTVLDWTSEGSPKVIINDTDSLMIAGNNNDGDNIVMVHKKDNTLWSLMLKLNHTTCENIYTPIKIFEDAIQWDTSFAIKSDHTLWVLSHGGGEGKSVQVEGIENVIDMENGIFTTSDNSKWTCVQNFRIVGRHMESYYTAKKVDDSTDEEITVGEFILKSDKSLWIGQQVDGTNQLVKLLDNVETFNIEGGPLFYIYSNSIISAVTSDHKLWFIERSNGNIIANHVYVNVLSYKKGCVITTDHSLYDLQIIFDTNLKKHIYNPVLVLKNVVSYSSSSSIDNWYIQRTDGTTWKWRGNYSTTQSNVNLYVPELFDLPIQNPKPTVSGITDGMVYNRDVSFSFDMGLATLNGAQYFSGTQINNEGNYTLILKDDVETFLTIHFTIDKTPPVITIGAYDINPTNKKITVSATTNEGTLNFTSHTFTANGSFDFVATDAAGNRTSRTVILTNIDNIKPIISNPVTGSNRGIQLVILLSLIGFSMLGLILLTKRKI